MGGHPLGRAKLWQCASLVQSPEGWGAVETHTMADHQLSSCPDNFYTLPDDGPSPEPEPEPLGKLNIWGYWAISRDSTFSCDPSH